MKKRILKRWAAGLLAGALVFTGIPQTTAMATEGTQEGVTEEANSEVAENSLEENAESNEQEAAKTLEESAEKGNDLFILDEIGNGTDTDTDIGTEKGNIVSTDNQEATDISNSSQKSETSLSETVTTEATTTTEVANTETTETTTTEATTITDEATALASSANSSIALTSVEDVVSPEVDGKDVTFRYYAPDADSVSLAGEMNNWDKNATAMTKDDETGIWSVTLTLENETYQYKFVINDGDWQTDPANESVSNGNSLVTIAANHKDTIEYTYIIYYNDTDAYDYTTDDAALWIWSDGGAEGTEYFFTEQETLSDGDTWLKAEVTLSDDSINIIPRSKEGWSWQDATFKYANSTKRENVTLYLVKGEDKVHLTVPGEQTEYEYTIYYYAEDDNSEVYGKDDTALWIWTDGVNGSLYYFTAEEELQDGKTWVRANIILPYEKLCMIPRAYGGWDWQDLERDYNNEEKDSAVTLYMVQGDENIYTSFPTQEGEETLQRSVIVEYNRPDGQYADETNGKWNIYTWNSGYGDAVTVDFEEKDGKMAATVPVTKSKDTLSFCMRRSTSDNAWAEKDGGDHSVAIPLDQTVVKARFDQGEGITEVLPYNIGYETDVANAEMNFYYRDDALYAAYEEASLEGKVELVWDGNTYDMSYDADHERYTYTGDLTEGKHYYGYLVDGKLVVDAFNDVTVDVEGTTYSSYDYNAFDITVDANVSMEEMDYGKNAVLTVDLNGDADILSQIKVASVTADLSALGGKDDYAIDPELMAGTIAVTQSTSNGTKTIPITVKDQYGNIYTTETNVKVVPRTESDFDWEEAVIYFAVTDRFFDGDSSNNGGSEYAPAEGSTNHGGDFAGLTEKLDYLQDLGVNTVWITPIVSNMENVLDCDGYDGQHNSAYHGYWANDFTTLNSHLGTEAEFSKLIDELHKRGMKLMVDVVLNHAGYGTEDYFNSILDGKKMLRDSSNTISGDEKKGPLSNLPDFVTEDPDVRNMLVEWQSNWISKYDIDYYRVDTVKHVEDTTWKAFKNALTDIDPDFKMIGEYSGAGYATDAGQLRTGQMDALLDFDFNDKALSFVGGSLSSVENFLEKRNETIDNTATMGSFLGSHDEDGLLYRMTKSTSNEGLGFEQEKAYDLMKVAASLEITAKGQPIVYYGEELGQSGANNWPYQDNRYDYDWANANDDNEMLVHYKKMLAIRNSYKEVFAKGDRKTVTVDEAEGILVASRSYGADTLYVGLNVNQSEAKTVDISVAANGTYTDLYANKTYTAEDNKLTITIPGAENGGTIILVAGKKTTGEDSKPNKPNAGAISGATAGVITTPSRRKHNSSSSSNKNTNTTVTVKEPTVTKADGTVIKGWKNVVTDAITQASLADGNVPLAGGIEDATAVAQEAFTVELQIDNNTNKVIPADVVQTMIASGMQFRIQIGEYVIITLTQQTLATVTGALDLSLAITQTPAFSQGFNLFMMHTDKGNMLTGKVKVEMKVGTENAGKIAYIFCNKEDGTAIGFAMNTVVDAKGFVTVPSMNLTDCVVLFK